MAVIVSLPFAAGVQVHIAVPDDTGVEPHAVFELHATVPVTASPLSLLIVAVQVTASPISDGFGLQATTVVVVPVVDFSAFVFCESLAAGQVGVAGQVAVMTQTPLAPVMVTTSPLTVQGPVTVITGVGLLLGVAVTVKLLPSAAEAGAPVKVYGPHCGLVVVLVYVTSVIPWPMFTTALAPFSLTRLAGGWTWIEV
jgi:hypothetical protein